MKFWQGRKNGIMETKNAYFCTRNQKKFNLLESLSYGKIASQCESPTSASESESEIVCGASGALLENQCGRTGPDGSIRFGNVGKQRRSCALCVGNPGGAIGADRPFRRFGSAGHTESIVQLQGEGAKRRFGQQLHHPSPLHLHPLPPPKVRPLSCSRRRLWRAEWRMNKEHGKSVTTRKSHL